MIAFTKANICANNKTDINLQFVLPSTVHIPRWDVIDQETKGVVCTDVL